MKINAKASQSGRTLFEMLDVLAVIGVLSLVGIAGYRIAMTQYKANEIWNDVQLRAKSVRWIKDYNAVHLRQTNQDIDSFASLPTIGNSGYKITGSLHGGEDVFGAYSITVHDVPENVCEKVIQMKPDEVIGISPNDTSSSNRPNSYLCNNEDGKNDMRFYLESPNVCAPYCKAQYNMWKHNWSWYKEHQKRTGFVCHQKTINKNHFKCYGAFYMNDHYGWEHQDQFVIDTNSENVRL